MLLSREHNGVTPEECCGLKEEVYIAVVKESHTEHKLLTHGKADIEFI